MKMRAKKPATTEGMPESISMAGLMYSFNLGLASWET